jgi:hypothetical protein
VLFEIVLSVIVTVAVKLELPIPAAPTPPKPRVVFPIIMVFDASTSRSDETPPPPNVLTGPFPEIT